jgi:hypothetical protein
MGEGLPTKPIELQPLFLPYTVTENANCPTASSQPTPRGTTRGPETTISASAAAVGAATWPLAAGSGMQT